MKFDYIDPFLNGTSQTLSNMLQLDVTPGQFSLSEDVISPREANVSIGVTGDLKGTVLFSFPKEMALRMVSEMAGMPMAELDKFVTSAVGELANIISGQAMTNLNGLHYVCDIVPPHVMVGTDLKITMPTEQIVTVPMVTDMGDFDLYISLEKK